MNDNNLYASLSALSQFDSIEKQRAVELAELSAILTSLTSTNSDHQSVFNNFCAEMSTMKNNSSAITTCNGGDANIAPIPFDSPFDQSLGSPESSRDYQISPLQDYEFDFTNALAADPPLFTGHGTQEMADVPLFSPEFTFSQQSNKMIANEISTSQQTVAQTANDYSFDAMAQTIIADISNDRLNEIANANRPTSPSASSVASSQSQDQESINQLAAVFVREYARNKGVRDIEGLLSALRGAGINVSDQVVTDILESASSFSQSRSASPSVSSGSPMSSQSQTVDSSVSSSPIASSPQPVISVNKTQKTRSSAQVSAKDTYGKRFVCTTCHKQFDRAFNLRTHALTHVDPNNRDKPYVCPWSECSKPFMRKYDAERHYKSVHQRRGEYASKKEEEMAFSGEYGLIVNNIDQANG